jgi:hypothetical protein
MMVEVLRRLRPKTLKEKAEFSEEAAQLGIKTHSSRGVISSGEDTGEGVSILDTSTTNSRGCRASIRHAAGGAIEAIKRRRRRVIDSVVEATSDFNNAQIRLRKQGVGLMGKFQNLVLEGEMTDVDAATQKRRLERNIGRMKDQQSLALFLQANYTLTSSRHDLILAGSFRNKYKEFCAEQTPPIKYHPITSLSFELAAVQAFDPRERFQFKEAPEITRVMPDELKLAAVKSSSRWWKMDRNFARRVMYDAPIVTLQLTMTLLPTVPNFLLIWWAEVDNTNQFQMGVSNIAQQAGAAEESWRVTARDLVLRWWELMGMQVRIHHLILLGLMAVYLFVATLELVNYYANTMFGVKEEAKSADTTIEDEDEDNEGGGDDLDGESLWSLAMRLRRMMQRRLQEAKSKARQMKNKAVQLGDVAGGKLGARELKGGPAASTLEQRNERLLREALRELVKDEVNLLTRKKIKAAMKDGVGAGIKALVDPIVKAIAGANSRDKNADPKKLEDVRRFWNGEEPGQEWVKEVRPDGVNEEVDIPMMGDEASRLVSTRWKYMTKLVRLENKLRAELLDLFQRLFHRLLVLFMLFYLCCFVGYLALVGVWYILGAVLNPDVFLPYAAAAATLFTYCTTKIRQLRTIRGSMLRKVVEAVKARFDRTLRSVGVDQEAAERLLNGDMSKDEIKQRLLEKGTSEMMQRSPLGTVAVTLGVDAGMAAKLATGDESAIYDMAEKLGVDRHIMMALVAVVRKQPDDLEQAIGNIAANPGVPIEPQFAKILTKLAYKGGGERPEKLVKQAVNIFNQSDKTDIKMEIEYDSAGNTVVTAEGGGNKGTMKCSLRPEIAEAVVALAQGKLEAIVTVTDELAKSNPKMFPPALSALVNLVYYKSTNQSNLAVDAVVDIACSVNLEPASRRGKFMDRRLMNGLADMYKGDIEGMNDVLKALGVTKGAALIKIIIAIAQGNTALLRGSLLEDFTRELEKLLRLPDRSVNSNHLSALFACVQGTAVDTKALAALTGLDMRIAEAAIFMLDGRRLPKDEVVSWNMHPIAWLADTLNCPEEYLLGVIALLHGHSAYPESQLLIDFTITSIGLDPKVKRPIMQALDFFGSKTERKVVAAALQIYTELSTDFRKTVSSEMFAKLVLIGRGQAFSEAELVRHASGQNPVQEIRAHIESIAAQGSADEQADEKAVRMPAPPEPLDGKQQHDEAAKTTYAFARREYETNERHVLADMLTRAGEVKVDRQVQMQENVRLRWAVFKHDVQQFEAFVQAIMGTDHKLTAAATGEHLEGENEITIADFLRLVKKKAHKDSKRAEDAKISGGSVSSGIPTLSSDTVGIINSVFRLGNGVPSFIENLFFKAGAVTDSMQRACRVLCTLPTLFSTGQSAKRKQRIERTGLQLGKMLDVHPRCLAEFLQCALTPKGHDRAARCIQVIKAAGAEEMELVSTFIEQFTRAAEQSAQAEKAVDKFADSVKIPRFVLHAIRTGSAKLGDDMVKEMYKLISMCIDDSVKGPGTAHSMARSLVALVMGNETRLEAVAQAFGLDALFLGALCKSYQNSNLIDPKREVIRRVMQQINENEIRAMVMHRVRESNEEEIGNIRILLEKEHREAANKCGFDNATRANEAKRAHAKKRALMSNTEKARDDSRGQQAVFSQEPEVDAETAEYDFSIKYKDKVTEFLLQQAFRMMDIDASNDLTEEEFDTHLMGTKLRFSESEKDRLVAQFALIDQDGDRRVSYEEFSDFLCPKQDKVRKLPALCAFNNPCPIDVAVGLVAFAANCNEGEYTVSKANAAVKKGLTKWPALETQLGLTTGVIEGLVCGARKDVKGLKRAVRHLLSALPGDYALDTNFIEGFMSISTDGTGGIEDMAVRLSFDPDVAEALVLIASGDGPSCMNSQSVDHVLTRLGLDAEVMRALIALTKNDIANIGSIAEGTGLHIAPEFLLSLISIALQDPKLIDNNILPLAQIFGISSWSVASRVVQLALGLPAVLRKDTRVLESISDEQLECYMSLIVLTDTAPLDFKMGSSGSVEERNAEAICRAVSAKMGWEVEVIEFLIGIGRMRHKAIQELARCIYPMKKFSEEKQVPKRFLDSAKQFVTRMFDGLEESYGVFEQEAEDDSDGEEELSSSEDEEEIAEQEKEGKRDSVDENPTLDERPRSAVERAAAANNAKLAKEAAAKLGYSGEEGMLHRNGHDDSGALMLVHIRLLMLQRELQVDREKLQEGGAVNHEEMEKGEAKSALERCCRESTNIPLQREH